MATKRELISGFAELIPFLERLGNVDESLWQKPLGEGKWCVRDVVAHIALWDKYFMENGVAKVAAGKEPTIGTLDFEEFNRAAVEWAKTKTQADVIEEAVRYRAEILGTLEAIPEEAYAVGHPLQDGSNFVIAEYIRDFTWHDNHHRAQIETLIA